MIETFFFTTFSGVSTALLAKFLGLFFTVMGLGFTFNQKHIKDAINVLADNAGIQFAATIIPLLVGSCLIAIHNNWTSGPAIFVSAIGWVIFIGGTFRAILPSVWLSSVKACKNNFAAGTIGIVMLIIGLALLYISLSMHA